MRRLTTIIATAGLLLAGAAPAGATTTVISRVGLPSGFSFIGDDCAGVPASSMSHDEDPISGIGWLALDASAGGQAELSYHLAQLDDLTAWTVNHTEGAGSGDAVAYLSIQHAGGNRFLLSGLTHANSFAVRDLRGLTFDLYDESLTLLQSNVTLGSYLMSNPSDATVPADAVMGAMPCLDPATMAPAVAVDSMGIGINGVDTIYDFEGPPAATTTSISAAKPVMTYGGSDTLSGTLTFSGGALEGAAVELWGKPAGSSYRKVTTVTSGPSGTVSATVKPTRTTTYQWRFPGSPDFAASSSPALVVGVAPKVTIALDRTRIRLGQRFTAKGKTGPKLAGVTVSIMRKTSGGAVKVGSGKTRKDGTYSVTITAHQLGTWNVYAKTAATTAYASGFSPTWSLVVS